MKKHNWILGLLLLLIAQSCADGNFDENGLGLIEDKVIETSPLRPIMIDIVDANTITGVTQLEITDLPMYGEVRLLEDGRAIYVPNIDFIEGEDRIYYALSDANGPIATGMVLIQIFDESTVDACDNGGLWPEIYCTDSLIVEDITFDIALNDSICGDIVHFPSTLSLMPSTLYGNARVEEGKIIYRVSDETFNGANEAFTDIIFYEIEVSNNGNMEKAWSTASFKYDPNLINPIDSLDSCDWAPCGVCETALLDDEFTFTYSTDDYTTVGQFGNALDSLTEILDLDQSWPVFQLPVFDNDMLCGTEVLLTAQFDSTSIYDSLYIFAVDNNVLLVPMGYTITGDFDAYYRTTATIEEHQDARIVIHLEP